jgi:hypothetical protein
MQKGSIGIIILGLAVIIGVVYVVIQMEGNTSTAWTAQLQTAAPNATTTDTAQTQTWQESAPGSTTNSSTSTSSVSSASAGQNAPATTAPEPSGQSGGTVWNFNPLSDPTFTLALGQSTTDGAGGVTITLYAIGSGENPSAVTTVVSASSTLEAYIAGTWPSLGLTPDEYAATAGHYLSASAKFGNAEWPDPNSPTGVVTITVTSIDMANQTVTFTVGTTPVPNTG